MSSKEIREKFLEFFKERGHKIVPSSSLVPENDPTTLFTGSGMQPLIPYLLGETHPAGKRVANSQKCFRAEDIDEVGDNRHTTFFEMLGNWSFGDYWKEEQLSWLFEFLTEEVGLDPNKLYVTVFSGDVESGVDRDGESVNIWKRLFEERGVGAEYANLETLENGGGRGIKNGERIFGYGAKKNWWSRVGMPANMPVGEPGGPDSEIFFEFTGVEHDTSFGKYCHPNCDCGRFLEIGNSVFMEYRKRQDGGFEKLPRRNVDFGGGLERITAAQNDNADIFQIDIFADMDKRFPVSGGNPRKKRVVFDHLRSAIFLLADDVEPSNKGQGYILRRLMRRASLHLLGLFGSEKRETLLFNLISSVGKTYRDSYPEIDNRFGAILIKMGDEIDKFEYALDVGLREFRKLAKDGKISGRDAFVLFATYGFPYEMAFELADEKGITINRKEFEMELKKHQELSRTASAGVFKGGLADTAEKTIKLHTAHHLLLKAAQIVLGPHVKQRGSNITSERLRMDFSHDAKLTEEEKREIERVVNEKITEDLPVIRSEMALKDAEKLGAEREFGQKYGERVSVYSVGPKTATPKNQQFEKSFSIEFCGGPHVTHTGEIGKFRIAKEEAVGAGTRRIRGVVE